jgi:CRP-like cAMP-binding protein
MPAAEAAGARSKTAPNPMAPAARRLAALAPLSTEELQLVLGLGGVVEQHLPGHQLVEQDAQDVRPIVIVDGWACRQRVLPDGRRQIFSFLLAGDAIGLSLEPSSLATCATVALTHVTCVRASALRTAVIDPEARWPGLARAVRLAERMEQALLLDHVMRLGRQSAHERVAHLLLELHQRLTIAGLALGSTMVMPLTQEVMADALGLSIVHLNRVLQRFRRERLIEMGGRRTTLLEPQLLAEIADYPLGAPHESAAQL